MTSNTPKSLLVIITDTRTPPNNALKSLLAIITDTGNLASNTFKSLLVIIIDTRNLPSNAPKSLLVVIIDTLVSVLVNLRHLLVNPIAKGSGIGLARNTPLTLANNALINNMSTKISKLGSTLANLDLVLTIIQKTLLRLTIKLIIKLIVKEIL